MGESGGGERWDSGMECEMGGEGLLAEGGRDEGSEETRRELVLRELARGKQEFWESKGDSR